MIEFTNWHGDNPCAINPRLVTEIHAQPNNERTLICFGSNDDEFVFVKEPYAEVLAAIREANADTYRGPHADLDDLRAEIQADIRGIEAGQAETWPECECVAICQRCQGAEQGGSHE